MRFCPPESIVRLGAVAGGNRGKTLVTSQNFGIKHSAGRVFDYSPARVASAQDRVKQACSEVDVLRRLVRGWWRLRSAIATG
jgi:hypothetical protein